MPTNADSLGSSLLDVITRLPAARDHDFSRQVRDAAANYQRSVQQRLRALDEDFEDAQTRIKAVAASAEEERQAVVTRVDEVGTSFESKVSQLEHEIAAEQTKVEQITTSQAENFRTAQNERDAVFKAATEEGRASFQQMLDQARQEVDGRVGEVRRMEKQTADLVGAIGLAGTAKSYGDEVKEQRAAADLWRWMTVGLTALAAVGVVVVALTLGHNPRWEEFVGKLTASLIFGGLATYTARQSARHREREKRARDFQLELTAFSPFIEPLSDEQKEEERVVMTRKTFGKANTEIASSEEPGPQPLSFVVRRKERETTEIP
jgi:hypothetical protein